MGSALQVKVVLTLAFCVGTTLSGSVTPEKTYNCELPWGCPTKTQKYLEYLGYLNPEKNCTKEDIHAALRKFQEFNINFMNISVTGECDQATVAVMNMPRCGCEDIVKFEKKMMPQNLTGPQSYTLGSTKWRKRELTWSVLKYPQTSENRQLSQASINDAMRRALDIWSKVTTMSFRQVTNDPNADIKIKFEVRHHDPGGPPNYGFDGRGGTLAHAFFPESGDVHFDDEELFVLNSDRGTELYIVAAHEFGHTLGISHSNIQDALMAPYYRYSRQLELHQDDIAAVQSLYGPPDRTPPTQQPPSTPPTTIRTAATLPTRSAPVPDYCNMQIQGAFNIRETAFVFTRERVGSSLDTFVYKVGTTGLDVNSRKPIKEMFVKSSTEFFPRAYPYRVDAATYVPGQSKIFLFSGTRAYRYSVTRASGPFVLDTNDGYPRWMDVSEFPERPRAAVAIPYSNYNAYYMLIFGTTMVWDWNFISDRVGAWAYPINVYGRNMPERVDGAILDSTEENVLFFKNDNYYMFSLKYRRVLNNSVFDIKKDFLKGRCA